MLIELTMMQGDSVFVNPSHIMRIVPDPDREGSTLLYFCDGTRQLVREPIREVIGLFKISLRDQVHIIERADYDCRDATPVDLSTH